MTPTPEPEQFLDEDAVIACANLAGRSGATAYQVGYLHDDVPSEQAGWYAYAQYKGARLTVENQRGPVEAADALARRILRGAQCTHCHHTVTLSAVPTPGKKCLWERDGRTWNRGCEPPQFRTDPHPCPVCSVVVDGVTAVTSDQLPKPGNVTICIYCASVLFFTDELALRTPTDAELVEAHNNVDVRKAQAAARAMIAARQQ